MRLLTLAAAISLALPLSAPVEARSERLKAPAGAAVDARSSYIVSFDEPAAPLFRGFQAKDGRHPALAPVAIDVTGQAKYDPERPEAEAYLAYIGTLREQRLDAASGVLGRDLVPRFVYEHALNGVALDLTVAEAETLAGMPGIRAVTPDFERRLFTDRGPNWIKAPTIWTGSAGVASRGEGVVVGVIDSGINPTHASFAATAGGFTHTNPKGALLGWCATPANASVCNNKLIGVYDFISGGTNGTSVFTPDPDGHGTHVAATAVGNPVSGTIDVNNVATPVDITGVAPRANLISYRGCGSTPGDPGCGPNGGSALIASINRAIADQVDVINYSIGGNPVDPWLTIGGAINSDEEAFLAAREAGIVVVAAAGNRGPNPGTHSNPANAPWVIGVAAVTHDRLGTGDRLASFSGRGPVTPLGVVKPDVAAPGVEIRAAGRNGNEIVSESGTSMATPHVAGAAALLAGARPSWNADQIVSALMLTARPEGIVLASNGAATTPHDRGAGTIDLSLAANASLALAVPAGAFRNASEATASTLNLPSLASANCVDACTLTRTVSLMPGAPSGQYEVVANLPSSLPLTVTPSTFSLSGSATQALEFRFGTNAQTTVGNWAYGSVTLRRVGGGSPDLKLPVAIFQSGGVVPALQQRTVSGDRGFADFNLSEIVSLPNARFSSSELFAPAVRDAAVPQDSTNLDPYDNLFSGVFFHRQTINYNDGRARSVQVNVTLAPSSSPAAIDLDLFAGVDTNLDNLPEKNEERCTSVSPGATESCSFTVQHPGNGVPIDVWALAQNYQSSSPGATDRGVLEIAAIDDTPSTRQKATGPGNVPANAAFSARLVYDDPTFLNGQSRYGYLLVDRGPNNRAIRVPFKLTRNSAAASPFAMSAGVDRTIVLPANGAQEFAFIDVPAGATQLTVTTASSANVDLYLARVPPIAPAAATPTIAAAPARGSATASATTASGDETVTVANPQAGRWYLTPVNVSGATASLTLRATIAGTAPSIRPGGYFNPERSGHGFFLYPAGSQLAGLWYTYYADGTPTWYYLQGAAPGSNGFWTGQLYRSAWNGSANSLVEVGTATVSPTAANEFTFSYNLDGETGSEAFRNFGGGCPTLSGSALNVSSHWFNPATAGSGYSVQMFPNYEFYTVFAYDGLGQPRYLIAERATFGGATATTSLEQINGFCPLCTRTGTPTRSTIGTFSRSFSGGAFSNITLNGTFQNGVQGTWTANESVGALGNLQGCTP
ncbi:S8 family serine peptidase [Silanimonas sp.]|jgi:subtilisin family serine protease|uniref:S8 family serine peptidase n=1 Tax=Silanimonas sp. TaxID=1929290 RepID=UPI0022CA77F5|nr:S8 family serine peptidase [Silanimonas sp.]MCZ8113787.1 S8 family serine peptidase [Silanimonas sp.]